MSVPTGAAPSLCNRVRSPAGYHQFACMSPEALRYWRGLDGRGAWGGAGLSGWRGVSGVMVACAHRVTVAETRAQSSGTQIAESLCLLSLSARCRCFVQHAETHAGALIPLQGARHKPQPTSLALRPCRLPPPPSSRLAVIFIFWASVPLTFAMAYFVMPLPYALGLTAVALALSLHAWHNGHSLPAGAEINKKANTRYVGLVVLVYTSPAVLQACKDLAGMLLSGAAGASQLPYEVYDPLYAVKCAAALAFCFAYGGVTYVASFPDVYAPGMFDIVVSGHEG